MRFFGYYLLFFSWLVLFSCQNRPLNLSQAVLDQAENLMSEHPDSALYLLENGIEVRNLSSRQEADWGLFLTQARDKNYIEHTSDSLIRHSVSYYEKHNIQDRLVYAYYYNGRVLEDIGDATQAQNLYLKALEIGKNSGDFAILLRIHNTLGMLYTYQEAYELAIPQLEQAQQYAELLNDSKNLSYIHRNLARTYGMLDNQDLCMEYYQQALEYANEESRPSIILEFGTCYMEMEDYSKAYTYIKEALQLATDSMNYFPACLAMGEYYFQTDKPDSASYYLNLSEKSPNLYTKAASYLYLSQIARNNRNYEEIILLYDRYEEFRSTITDEHHTESIRHMQNLYNYELVEKEANLYKIKHIADRRKILLLLLSALLFCSISVSSVFYLRRRQQEWAVRYKKLVDLLNGEKPQYDFNDNRIKKLRSELNNSDKQSSELSSIEQKILALYSEKLEQGFDEKKKLDTLFRETDIYHFFCSTNDLGKITAEKIETLKQIIDTIYPGFRNKLQTLLPKISDKEIDLCYYLKADIKLTNMARITEEPYDNIKKRRTRLQDKLRTPELSNFDLETIVFMLY